MLTHDVEQQKRNDTDPLITREIDAHYLLDLLKAGKRIVEDAAAITIPTLLLSAGKDYVVKDVCKSGFLLTSAPPKSGLSSLKGFITGYCLKRNVSSFTILLLSLLTAVSHSNNRRRPVCLINLQLTSITK